MHKSICPSASRLLGTAFVLWASGSAAYGQSLSASGVVGVTNSSVSGYVGGLASQSSADGSPIDATASKSFTGLDRSGSVETMSFTGEIRASANYGQLHSDATGAVTNTYYNAANPVYYDSDTNTFNPAGSPDGLDSLGFADFNDTLQFGGALQAGYKASYVFHIDGTNTGVGALADLSVTIGDNPAESFFASDTGVTSTDWATQQYAIDGTNPQSIQVQFSDQFDVNTYDYPDGSNLSGESNFSDTVTLSAIQIFDSSGNLVSGVTITSASGTSYPVPEPASLVVVLAGLLLRGLCRHRSITS